MCLATILACSRCCYPCMCLATILACPRCCYPCMCLATILACPRCCYPCMCLATILACPRCCKPWMAPVQYNPIQSNRRCVHLPQLYQRIRQDAMTSHVGRSVAGSRMRHLSSGSMDNIEHDHLRASRYEIALRNTCALLGNITSVEAGRCCQCPASNDYCCDVTSTARGRGSPA
jgi:hypothetical protein